MTLFWKATAGILITVVLGLAIGKQERDLSLILIISVCVMVVVAAFHFFKPILELLYRLEKISEPESEILGTLLKITGIGLISETVCMICRDSGSNSLAKAMQFLGTVVILYISVPIMESLLDLLQMILGEL